MRGSSCEYNELFGVSVCHPGVGLGKYADLSMWCLRFVVFEDLAIESMYVASTTLT
jgi:hypothetical protein